MLNYHSFWIRLDTLGISLLCTDAFGVSRPRPHDAKLVGLMPRGKGPGDPSEPPTTGFSGHMVELDHFCQIP